MVRLATWLCAEKILRKGLSPVWISQYWRGIIEVSDLEETVSVDRIAVHRHFVVPPPITKRVGRAAEILSGFFDG